MFSKNGIDRSCLSVLLVSPAEDDFRLLDRILNDVRELSATGAEWCLRRHSTPKSALNDLKKSHASILICECDLSPNSWRILVEEIGHLPNPPLLIVTSRLADERLWAEALNLGAWDVLATPLEIHEVSRTLKTAWLQWCSRQTGSASIPAARAPRLPSAHVPEASI